MSKKNIVSIEDRIPKLKQARKKKANRRLIFYLSIFFFLIAIIVYLQSPLSHIKTINVEGNGFIANEKIIEYSNLTTNTNIWTIDQHEIEKAIRKDPIVESVSVERSLPWTVNIDVKEQRVIGYISKDMMYYPILGNGEILKEAGESFRGDAPLFFDFEEEEYLQRMAAELEALPQDILDVISEVHWDPAEDNKNNILLYMNDGYTVKGTIRNFADRMEVYPSIVSQLDPEDRGIIHIGVGVYFESFNENDENENEESESNPETDGHPVTED
ncbi:cell division protein FtsQ/DivIB [Oceanobacillus massiliensis]|uniref:cell division protein FtsQ/DivIB n=1 Tax=Oceanobacillus massiliensis TaxID=1465765 RepID=UPI00301B3882